jgi:poly-gamma-glutamate capsule biosynthesis protein CapA/YwtB (metallophosphatase superfamily)
MKLNLTAPIVAATAAALASAAWSAPCPGAPAPHPGPVPDGFTLAAAGDIIYQRPSLPIVEHNIPELLKTLRGADVSFGNFESNTFDIKTFPGTLRRPVDGPILLTPPKVTREIRAMGFDLVSHANNHAADWGPEGILATDRNLCAAGLVNAGDGRDLASARAPTYFSAKGVSVGLVAAAATFSPADPAADAWGPIRARAGVDPLHIQPVQGQPYAYTMDQTDLTALLAEVAKARHHAGLVFFSLHTHEAGPSDGVPTDFEIALAHQVIDAGADGFLGHGPHQLRGIEIYKGKPIFYSLANFAVMQPTPSLNQMPLVIIPGSIFTHRVFFESMVVESRYEGGKLAEIRIQPFELAQTGKLETHGLPHAVSPEAGQAILTRLQTLSAPFGTKIDIENGVGVIRLSQ